MDIDKMIERVLRNEEAEIVFAKALEETTSAGSVAQIERPISAKSDQDEEDKILKMIRKAREGK